MDGWNGSKQPRATVDGDLDVLNPQRIWETRPWISRGKDGDGNYGKPGDLIRMADPDGEK